MRVAVIDAGGANLGSVCNALQRLGAVPVPTADARLIEGCERVILPGVGHAAAAMARLHASGLVALLRALRQPLLGICLGMQLLFEHSEEGDVDCLGLLPGQVRRLQPAPGIRIPHMGWNRLRMRDAGSLLEGVGEGEPCYFVHGFAAPVTSDCVAWCSHGQAFAAVVQRGHTAGVQFHPERSGVTGARILANFLSGALACG